MTAPIGTHVGEILEPMRNAVIELFFIGVGFGVGLADTFCDNFGVALLMARVFAVLALHAGRVFEEVSTQGAAHDVVELLKHELVAVKFMDVLFALPDCTFSIKPNIKRSSVFCLFR